jgi:Ankyrin repeats (many copies)
MHIAADGQSIHMLKFAAREWPQSLLEPNKGGMLPIHIAIRAYDKRADKVQFLAEECPESLQVRDRGGQHPLHNAIGRASSLDLVQALARGWPEGLLERDSFGWLPVQIAAAHPAVHLDTTYLLLRMCPQVLRR